MTDRAASWQTTAAYHLAEHWFGTGDYARAEAAYREVLTEMPDHAPSLFNLAVARIRLGANEAALETLNSLTASAGTNKAPPRVDLAIAYNRALALHYLERHPEAVEASERLARDVLAEHTPSRWRPRRVQDAERRSLERMDGPALMLHAGVSIAARVARMKDPVDGALTPVEDLAKQLDDAVDGALVPDEKIAKQLDDELGVDNRPDDEDSGLAARRRARLLEELGDSRAATHIEWYVRLKARDDARTRYNLACHFARLAAFTPHRDKAVKLRDRAVEHAKLALRDHRLVSWAEKDPSLESLERHRAWPRVLATAAGRAPTDTMEAPPTDSPRQAEPKEPEGSPEPVERLPEPEPEDLRALVGQAHELLEKVFVGDPSPALVRLPGRWAAAVDALEPSDVHAALIGAFAALHDPTTAHVLPSPQRGKVTTWPFMLERYLDGDRERYVVAAVSDEVARDLPCGAEVTHWNGIPIAAAVEAGTGMIAAPTPEARTARAVAALTHRPVDLLGPVALETAAIRYVDAGQSHEAIVPSTQTASDWRSTVEPDAARLLSTDELGARVLAAQRALRLNSDVRLSRAFPAQLSFASRQGYGYLRIRGFDVADANAFAGEVAAILSRLPDEGVVIDLRANPGGLIPAAEYLIQLFTPRQVRPQALVVRASDLTLRLARGVPELADWREPIAAAIASSSHVTKPFPLAPGHEAACNRIGQRYHGPVLLIVDALTAGAASFLTAGFERHGIGTLMTTSPAWASGARLSNAWSHDVLAGLLPGSELVQLQNDASFTVSLRTSEGDEAAGDPLRHSLTRNDLVEDDQDLLATAVARLKQQTVRVLRANLELVPKQHIHGSVTTRAIPRLEVYVDDKQAESGLEPSVGDGTHPVRLKVDGAGPYSLELRGLDDAGTPVARRRITIGGV